MKLKQIDNYPIVDMHTNIITKFTAFKLKASTVPIIKPCQYICRSVYVIIATIYKFNCTCPLLNHDIPHDCYSGKRWAKVQIKVIKYKYSPKNVLKYKYKYSKIKVLRKYKYSIYFKYFLKYFFKYILENNVYGVF